MLQAWGALVCGVTRKHLRGKRVMSAADAEAHGDQPGKITLRFGRCGKTWQRKVKKVKAGKK